MPGYAMYSSSDNSVNLGSSSKADKKGMFISVPIIIVLALIFAFSVVGVALIVHFTAPKCVPPPPLVTTTTSPPTATTTAATSPSITTEIMPTTTPPLVKDVRLPTNVKPVHYTVVLAPYMYGTNASDFYFSGSVRVQVNVSSATTNIKLHSDRITFNMTNLRVFDEENNKTYSVMNVTYDPKRQWNSIDLDEPLQVSENVVIEITRFTAPLRSDLRGLYLSSYFENGKIQYIATSQLQPTDARKTFPCFDEPAFKATFAISLVRRQDYKSISNMPSQTLTNVSGSQWFPEMEESDIVVKEDFETTPKMSSYLLAFIVSQFNSIEAKDTAGRVYRNWARPEFVSQTNYSLMAVQNITQYFESYFNVSYPLNKTDQAAVPDFNAGAMENWGLIIYRESRLVFDAEKDTSAIYQAIGSVVSHELAHMWFGNLVTPDWWDDIWLNEGFASFVQTIGVDNLHKDWEIDAQFVPTQQLAAFDVDSKGNSHPIYTEVYNPDQINEIFDTITYRKGATVLRMLHHFVGDDVFRMGVGNYLRNNAYQNTFHTVLYESLTQQYKESRNSYLNVSRVMDRWIKQMGYPVLNCTLNAGNLTLTQNHFLSDPSQVPSKTSEFGYKWIIPVTMATNENISQWNGETVADRVHWMEDKEQSFNASGASKWYLLNLRSAGFYRVNYDSSNWQALTDQLRTDHTVFSPQDRSRLIDDSFSLANAGYLSYTIPMELTRYLRNETHYVPWLTAMSKLNYMHSMLHRQSPEYGPFSTYMRSLLDGVFKSVGMDFVENELHLNRLKRELIVFSACLYGVRECEKNSTDIFNRYVDSNFTININPDVRRRVLCEGVLTSFAVEWDKLFKQTKVVSHPGVQNDIIRSLACTSEPWILNQYLDYALEEDKIRRQDSSTVFSSVAANPNGLQIVWDYLQRNWDQIQQKVPGSFTVSYFINNLANFNTEQKLDEMERFKQKHGAKLGAATRAMDLALESVRININWMKNNLPVLSTWLDGVTSSLNEYA